MDFFPILEFPNMTQALETMVDLISALDEMNRWSVITKISLNILITCLPV